MKTREVRKVKEMFSYPCLFRHDAMTTNGGNGLQLHALPSAADKRVFDITLHPLYSQEKAPDFKGWEA